MASNPRSQTPAPASAPATQSRGPFIDSAPRRTRIEEFEIPNRDGLWDEVTQDFGSIRAVRLQRLTPLQEKHALKSLKDSSDMGTELSRRSLVSVRGWVGDREEVFHVAEHDGSASALWAQVDPRIRLLVMKAYATLAVPSEEVQEDFIASRRTIVE